MTSAEKAAMFRHLLTQGWTNLLVDARRPGVSVPPGVGERANADSPIRL